MRKLKSFVLSLLSVLSVFIASCSKEGEKDRNPPILILRENNIGISDGKNGRIDATTETDLAFSWEARKGDADLEDFDIAIDGVSISKQTNNGNTLPYKISNADDEIYKDGITLNLGTSMGDKVYSFTVTDKKDLNDKATITVKVTAPTTPLTNKVKSNFFHIEGSLEGAYDLVNETEVSISEPDANKDMKNTDMAGAGFTGSWEAANSTSFVKVSTSFDYENASVETAAIAYAAGAASPTVTNPDDNDIYIAKLRGSSDFAVIKIIRVDPTDNTCNCSNTGKVEFEFKTK